MNTTEPIVNRVAGSGLITLDLEEYYFQGERRIWDMADYLFEGLILKEKDFRERLKNTDWSEYAGTAVAVINTADVIIPTWAYMLVVQNLSGVCHKVVAGSVEILEYALFRDALSAIEPADFTGARVVIKGCGKFDVPPSAYAELTALLVPEVTSLMFGEACSTVPVYKKSVRRTKP